MEVENSSFFSMSMLNTHTHTHSHTHPINNQNEKIRVNNVKAKLKEVRRLKLKFIVLHSPFLFVCLFCPVIKAVSVTTVKDRNWNNEEERNCKKKYRKFLK